MTDDKKDEEGVIRSEDDRVIITPPGVGLKHPEGVPEENIGQPEFTDWRERAFDLARQIERKQQAIESATQSILSSIRVIEMMDGLMDIADRHIAKLEREQPRWLAAFGIGGALLCLFVCWAFGVRFS